MSSLVSRRWSSIVWWIVRWTGWWTGCRIRCRIRCRHCTRCRRSCWLCRSRGRRSSWQNISFNLYSPLFWQVFYLFHPQVNWGLGCAREHSLIKLSRVTNHFLPDHWIPKHSALVVKVRHTCLHHYGGMELQHLCMHTTALPPLQ